MSTDYIYGNLRYLLNPDSKVPLVIAERTSGVTRDTYTHYLIPVEGFLIRIIYSRLADMYFSRVGKLGHKTIHYTDCNSRFDPNAPWEGLRWYRKLNIEDPATVEKSMMADPGVDFEFTTNKFFSDRDLLILSEHSLYSSYHHGELVYKYLKAWRGDE